MIKKPSFLERLTGGVKIDTEDDSFDDATDAKMGMMDTDMEPAQSGAWADDTNDAITAFSCSYMYHDPRFSFWTVFREWN
jgi:hypothetical protein